MYTSPTQQLNAAHDFNTHARQTRNEGVQPAQHHKNCSQENPLVPFMQMKAPWMILGGKDDDNND
jgi:hypothetical protein